MNARQTLVLNRALDGMKGKLTNAKWTTMRKCSAYTALRDINDLLARGVLGGLEGVERSAGHLLAKQGEGGCQPIGKYRSSSSTEKNRVPGPGSNPIPNALAQNSHSGQ